MHKRIRLKRKIKRRKLNVFHKIIIIFILLILALIIIFRYINKQISPYISEYASLEAKNVASFIINKAISKNISSILNIDDLFVVSKNQNDEISTVDFNPLVVNNVLTQITEVIHSHLKLLEEGKIEELDLPESSYWSSYSKRKKGIIFEIPSGIVFNNALLSNLGPKVPIKLLFIGDIISNIDTKVTNYGINNALIQIDLHLVVTAKVILPITINEINVELSVPLSIKIIQGNIPNYYLGGLNGSSSVLTVPVE